MTLKRIIAIGLLLTVIFDPSLVLANDVEELKKLLEERKKTIELLESKQAEYAASIKKKQQEAHTLSNQISIINDQLEKTKLGIQTLQNKIVSTGTEINQLEASISTEEAELAMSKQQLAATIRQQARTEDQSILQLFFLHDSFDEFYTEVQAYEQIKSKTLSLINEIVEYKQALTEKKIALEDQKNTLSGQRNALASAEDSLSDRQELQKQFLQKTKLDEKKFAALLKEVQKEQEEADREVARLEKEMRAKLELEGKISNTAAVLDWPVPKSRVTTYFHDPDYPFNHLFKHNAIDIRAPQRTEIKAPADGYVAKVRTGDPKRYWYVMLIHDGGITTVYGHVSRVMVTEGQRVSKGQAIALSGAMPGTPGAGPFTTGPHLHFEVHKNGTPVNPLDYLP